MAMDEEAKEAEEKSRPLASSKLKCKKFRVFPLNFLLWV